MSQINENSNSIVFYTTPAYGHISPALDIMKAYVKKGFTVYSYSTKEFKNIIELTGATFKEYAFDSKRLDLTVASKLLRLQDTILTFTNELTDNLLKEAEEIKPLFIFHDNIAMWGRIIGKVRNIPAVSVNTFPVVPSVISKGAMKYTMNFGYAIWKDFDILPHLWKQKKIFRKKYPKINCSMLSVILNKERLNIVTFPKFLQPGYKNMAKEYLFIGSSALHLDDYFGCSEEGHGKNIIFVSLGTIFQNNTSFFEKVVKELGNSKYDVIISMSNKNQDLLRKVTHIPDNIQIYPFVSQGKVLDKSCVFISASGMNSICQALHRNVPCLLYPQEGEQQITAEILCKMKLGKIHKSRYSLLEEIEELLSQFNMDEQMKKEFDEPDFDKMVDRISKYCEE